MRYSDVEMLAPVARAAFAGLEAALRRDTCFLAFETFRDPEQQLLMLLRGVSKAGPFESAHQFGLAVDFVPFIAGEWCWNVGDDYWSTLQREAEAFGLACPIKWDRAHVEHPAWAKVRRLTK